ncbi:hypothetical protein G7Y89_g12232 [Cudoniella acicularis]|uniref:Enoyl reductase (ER) domain-containing protein n=1 Tax=Cudoniella acicularis TaxID=354080 RepID=A0A8H4VX79_9HELO|nr:hypothetical protein G7Y89_g12232 [Cudoniella acicularis]
MVTHPPKREEVYMMMEELYETLAEMGYFERKLISTPVDENMPNATLARQLGYSELAIEVMNQLPYVRMRKTEEEEENNEDIFVWGAENEFLLYGSFADMRDDGALEACRDPFYGLSRSRNGEAEKGWDEDGGPYMRPDWVCLSDVGNHGVVMILDVKTLKLWTIDQINGNADPALTPIEDEYKPSGNSNSPKNYPSRLTRDALRDYIQKFKSLEWMPGSMYNGTYEGDEYARLYRENGWPSSFNRAPFEDLRFAEGKLNSTLKYIQTREKIWRLENWSLLPGDAEDKEKSKKDFEDGLKKAVEKLPRIQEKIDTARRGVMGAIPSYPTVLGGNFAGTVEEVGEGVDDGLVVGDQVFGFTWQTNPLKAHQTYVTLPTYLLGKIPKNSTPQAAVTLPDNLVTVFHSLTKDLDLSLPYPLPLSYAPAKEYAERPFLVWGGSSSVGQFAIQVLRFYGYKNIVTTASPKHFALLESFGATKCFDYRQADCISNILSYTSSFSASSDSPAIPLILDCIGSLPSSLLPISKLAKKGAKVAVLLPVIEKDSTETEVPIYIMDAAAPVKWEEGVRVRGVRTHFYLEVSFSPQVSLFNLKGDSCLPLRKEEKEREGNRADAKQNEHFKTTLQPKIVPSLLEKGIIKPNAYRLVEGETLLERAQLAMDILRRKEVSGERLVWRVSEE